MIFCNVKKTINLCFFWTSFVVACSLRVRLFKCFSFNNNFGFTAIVILILEVVASGGGVVVLLAAGAGVA